MMRWYCRRVLMNGLVLSPKMSAKRALLKMMSRLIQYR